MSKISKVVEEIEANLTSSGTDITECLKKARLIARYFNDLEILEWIENELKGYEEKKEDVPKYRQIRVTPYNTMIDINPVYGIKRTHTDYLKPIDSIPCFVSVMDIQQMITDAKEKKELGVELTIQCENTKPIPVIVLVADFQAILTVINLKLSDYIYEKQEIVSQSPYETPLMKIFNKFHKIAKQLEETRRDHPPLIIRDEYDVQYLLHGLLLLEFDSVQQETYIPKFAGKNSQVDFFLRYENTAIEVKKIRGKNHIKKIREEIINDKEEYTKDQRISNLFFFIYDPDSLIIDRDDFIKDLTENKLTFNEIKIIIKPDL